MDESLHPEGAVVVLRWRPKVLRSRSAALNEFDSHAVSPQTIENWRPDSLTPTNATGEQGKSLKTKKNIEGHCEPTPRPRSIEKRDPVATSLDQQLYVGIESATYFIGLL